MVTPLHGGHSSQAYFSVSIFTFSNIKHTHTHSLISCHQTVPSPLPHPHQSHTLTDHSPPTLESLCICTLLVHCRSYGFPSCGRVSLLVAQKLIKALKNEKRFHPKTLAAFHGWWVAFSTAHHKCLNWTSTFTLKAKFVL